MGSLLRNVWMVLVAVFFCYGKARAHEHLGEGRLVGNPSI